MTKQFILDIDECADAMNNATHKSSLCYNNGSCMNTLGSYTCNCTLGWEGRTCETGKFNESFKIGSRLFLRQEDVTMAVEYLLQ